MSDNYGGARKGSGRKKKVEEQVLVEKLLPLQEKAFIALETGLESGQSWAVKLFFEYLYGKPKERIEQKITTDKGVGITFGNVSKENETK